MVSYALKGMVAHKFRLLGTVFAVMLGVAFLAGTLVLTDTIGKTFDDLFTNAYERTDAVVRAEAAFGNVQGAGDQRGRVDETLVQTVAGVDGVVVAEGNVQGYAQLVDKDGKPIGDPSNGPPTLGGNWIVADELNPFSLVDGSPPSGDAEVVIDKKSANDAAYRVGDMATVLVKGPPLAVRIAGIAKFGDADSPGGASYVLFNTAAAQRLVAEPGKFDSIEVVGADGVSQEALADRIQAVVPSGVEVITGAEITDESQSDIKEDLSFFNIFMLIFAVVALLVGSFTIFNTFSITVAQRSRENALLRAIGASKRQILFSVLLEALVVGVLASIIGLAAGVAVAAGLKAALAGFGFELPGGAIVFSMRTVVISVIVGVVVTVIAAVSPARKAGKVPPVAAMRDIAVGSTGYGSNLRMIVGLGLLGLGVASMFAGLFAGGGSIALVGLAVLLVFFGVSVLGRTVALPLSRFLGTPFARARGIAGELARENAMRNPKRTAATAASLMIGVALVGFITILASSTRESINASIDKGFTGDFVIDSGTFGTGGFDPALAAQIGELPEVRAVTGVRVGAAEIDGSTQELWGLDRNTAFDIVDVKPIDGSPSALGEDDIAVHEDVAKDKGLALGNTLSVLFKDTGRKNLTVALIYGENQPAGDYLLSFEAYDANFVDQYDAQIFIDRADDVSFEAALLAIDRVAANYPGADVLDRAEYKKEQTSFVNQLLGLVYALLGLAILIALLGIANTLALSILERTRELGLLRAIGMTRAQLRSTVRWEAVVIALQGTLLGLVIGVFFGWAMVTALRDEGVDKFTVPFGTLALIVVLAGLAGLVAAFLPARRAAKLDILHAIAAQ